MGNNKRKKRGSSSSDHNDSDMANEEFDIRSSIDPLTNAMEAGFAIVQNEMGVDTVNIKFHAIHRVGKRMEGRCRPITA